MRGNENDACQTPCNTQEENRDAQPELPSCVARENTMHEQDCAAFRQTEGKDGEDLGRNERAASDRPLILGGDGVEFR